MMTLKDVARKLRSHADFVGSLGGSGELMDSVDLGGLADAIDFHLSHPQPVTNVEPTGFLYGNKYWESDNPRITDEVRKHGKKLYGQPQPVAQGEAVAWQFRNVIKGEVGGWHDIDRQFAEDPKHDDDPTIEIRRLYATPTIPTGHRVVPVEPDAAMSTAGMDAWDVATVNARLNNARLQWPDMMSVVYKAMLAAAPDAGGV